MKKIINDINIKVEEFTKEADKFVEKDVKAAGRKARKKIRELEKLFKEFKQKSLNK